MTMLPQAFWQGVDEFNQHQFYACHDTLEALWMEAAEPEKGFYQGILQLAVACYHLGNLNWRGAVILLGEGSRRLSRYQPIHNGIDVTQLLSDSTGLLKALQQIEPNAIESFVRQLEANSVDLGTSRNNGYACRLPKIIKVDS